MADSNPIAFEIARANEARDKASMDALQNGFSMMESMAQMNRQHAADQRAQGEYLAKERAGQIYAGILPDYTQKYVTPGALWMAPSIANEPPAVQEVLAPQLAQLQMDFTNKRVSEADKAETTKRYKEDSDRQWANFNLNRQIKREGELSKVVGPQFGPAIEQAREGDFSTLGALIGTSGVAAEPGTVNMIKGLKNIPPELMSGLGNIKETYSLRGGNGTGDVSSLPTQVTKRFQGQSASLVSSLSSDRDVLKIVKAVPSFKGMNADEAITNMVNYSPMMRENYYSQYEDSDIPTKEVNGKRIPSGDYRDIRTNLMAKYKSLDNYDPITVRASLMSSITNRVPSVVKDPASGKMQMVDVVPVADPLDVGLVHYLTVPEYMDLLGQFGMQPQGIAPSPNAPEPESSLKGNLLMSPAEVGGWQMLGRGLSKAARAVLGPVGEAIRSQASTELGNFR